VIQVKGAAMSTRPRLSQTLYGACYYNEYHPFDRLDQDFKDMEDANLTVLRVGESVWSTWEPRDGEFNLDWLQPVLDKAQSQGISVIIGVPTYAMPNWLRVKHPELMADRKTGFPIPFGHRQNMDYSNPLFVKYADRVIDAVVNRYKDHPAVIGWQVDNEPGVELFHNPGVFAGFKAELKLKFKTIENLNKVWGLVYWSHNINDWDELWIPDGNTNNGYDLEWRRFQARLTDRYIRWQAEKLKAMVPDHHFIMTCIALDRPGQDIYSVADGLDVIGANVYYPTQDGLLHPYSQYAHNREISGPIWMTSAGPSTVFRQADLSYSMLQDNYLVTETTATATVHVNSAGVFPPYPGQLKQVALGLVSRGANMVEYWHWHTLHYGAETYWGGILGHNYERGRTYQSFTEIAQIFKSQGDFLQDLKPDSPVALLNSPESKWAMEFQPAIRKTVNGLHAGDPDSYNRMFNAFYDLFHDAGLGINVYGANQLKDVENFVRKHPVFCVPGYLTSDDEALSFMDSYAKNGGHLILGPRTGYGNSSGTIRTTVAPGLLRDGAQAYYNEYTNLNKPAKVVGTKDKSIIGNSFGWADLLIAEGAEVVAKYDDPFLSNYAAITSAKYGTGRITMVGSIPEQALGKTIGDWVAKSLEIEPFALSKSAAVTVNSATTLRKERLHFLFNWGWEPATVQITKDSKNIQTGEKISKSASILLGPWDVQLLLESL
jgi:beta-galactosidase